MDLVKSWAESLVTKMPDQVRNKVSAKGVCKKHTGGLSMYAAVSITLEPAEKVDVDDQLPEEQRKRLRSEGWYEEIVYGVLDVLMTRPMTPISVFRLMIEHVEFNEMEARGPAFRLAARYAASECLNSLKFVVK